MKFERKIDKQKLKEIIQKGYGLNALNFEFVPVGEVAYSYILHCKNKKYFLKIYPKNTHQTNKNIDKDLKLLELLSEQRIKNISQVVKTKNNELKSRFCGETIAIFDYINGNNLSERKIDIKAITQITQLLAKIHKVSEKIPTNSLYQENFQINFEKDLLKSLEFVQKNELNQNIYKKKLKSYLQENKTNILKTLKRLKEIQQIIQKTKKDFVITHGDPTAHNLILDKNNNLHLVDWELTIFAPAERDIWFYLENYGQEFLSVYQKVNKLELDSNCIAFYFYKRNLEDLTDWLLRILYHNTTIKQDKNDFEGILTDCDLVDLGRRFKKIRKIIN